MGLVSVLISLLLGIVEVVLGLRIVFVFFNVTSETGPPIVSSIYDWSVPLVQPFANILPTFDIGAFTLDMPAIIALVVYGVIGGILIRVLRGR